MATFMQPPLPKQPITTHTNTHISEHPPSSTLHTGPSHRTAPFIHSSHRPFTSHSALHPWQDTSQSTLHPPCTKCNAHCTPPFHIKCNGSRMEPFIQCTSDSTLHPPFHAGPSHLPAPSIHPSPHGTLHPYTALHCVLQSIVL